MTGALIDSSIDLDAIDADLIARFRACVDELWPLEGRRGPLGLAVSGGPDSLALLLLAATALPDGIAAISVNHGLRPEAASEAALVRNTCARLGVPFALAEVTVEPGNLQAQARAARYAAFRQWAQEAEIGALATAHHADDQAETLLMRLARGSGLSGLAGVRASAHLPGSRVPLIRPLLTFRKAELETIVASVGITPARDPSNADPGFDRVRIRQHLAASEWLDAVPLAQSASHIAEAWQALSYYANLEWEYGVGLEEGGDQQTFKYFPDAPRIVQIETVCRIVEALAGRVSRSEAGRAVDRLMRGENASLGGVLARASQEWNEDAGEQLRVWRFSIEPPRKSH